MASPDPAPYRAPSVENRSPKPPGILPRNAHMYLMGGLALLMVVVIGLSGKNPPKERAASTPPPAQAIVDPSEARIREYRARIEEQARKLAAEQAQLAQAKQALLPPNALTAAGPSLANSGQPPPDDAFYSSGDREQNAIQSEKRRREYQSLFASNVALSYRQDAPETTREPAPGPVGEPQGTPTNARHTAESESALGQADGPMYRLFEGSFLETVLTNRLDGSFSGPVNCMVTANVYSRDRRHVLIPQGSRVLGEVRKVESFGQQRLALAFHRLIMPDGYSVALDSFQGLNQIGETGLVDQVNRHYLQIFGVSIAIGGIAGLSQANTRYGLQTSAADAYRQGVAGSLSQSSLNILERYLNVLPTFTIREGHRVKVYLTEDLLLPAHDRHRMPGGL